MRISLSLIIGALVATALGCGNYIDRTVTEPPEDGLALSGQAVVREISVKGEPGSYTFKVTVKSPDRGCSQYADWWEVIDREGHLIYRRVLRHSHTGQQPFARSGGKVEIDADRFVYVRAHMNNTGYGTQVMSGSVKDGFKPDSIASDFAGHLEKQEPLPERCAS